MTPEQQAESGLTLEEWMAQERSVTDELREARRLLKELSRWTIYDNELSVFILAQCRERCGAFLARTSWVEQQETNDAK